MKVSGTRATAGPTAAGAAKRSAGPAAFAPTMTSASAVGPAAPAAGVSSVDALIALQESSGPFDRRRRAAQRAGRILDVLDEMKLALLDGVTRPETFDRLRRLIGEERASTDNSPMEGVLDEIDLRAAVELAKLERATAAHGHAAA